MSRVTYESALIIGMGLIGSSIARVLKEKKISKKIFGLDKDDQVISISKKLNLIDEIENDLNIKSTKSLKNYNTSFDEKSGVWEYTKSIDDIAIFNNSYAVLILTEWKEFRKLNWKDISKKMVPPAWVFDSRSIINTDEVREAGLNLWRIGDGLLENK